MLIRCFGKRRLSSVYYFFVGFDSRMLTLRTLPQSHLVRDLDGLDRYRKRAKTFRMFLVMTRTRRQKSVGDSRIFGPVWDS